ncbi:unnamed protein product [Caenorhabditis auriculariae]|uniref:Uncharacterized protein n=1 Tax=Caenorhabditis auriculariae TaxID=2777116 RepID=A0A8S1H9M9_9PELO|nr:unnamed protein product [Caenorhabditis auriculariae]
MARVTYPSLCGTAGDFEVVATVREKSILKCDRPRKTCALGYAKALEQAGQKQEMIVRVEIAETSNSAALDKLGAVLFLHGARKSSTTITERGVMIYAPYTLDQRHSDDVQFFGIAMWGKRLPFLLFLCTTAVFAELKKLEDSHCQTGMTAAEKQLSGRTEPTIYTENGVLCSIPLPFTFKAFYRSSRGFDFRFHRAINFDKNNNVVSSGLKKCSENGDCGDGNYCDDVYNVIYPTKKEPNMRLCFKAPDMGGKPVIDPKALGFRPCSDVCVPGSVLCFHPQGHLFNIQDNDKTLGMCVEVSPKSCKLSSECPAGENCMQAKPSGFEPIIPIHVCADPKAPPPNPDEDPTTKKPTTSRTTTEEPEESTDEDYETESTTDPYEYETETIANSEEAESTTDPYEYETETIIVPSENETSSAKPNSGSSSGVENSSTSGAILIISAENSTSFFLVEPNGTTFEATSQEKSTTASPAKPSVTTPKVTPREKKTTPPSTKPPVTTPKAIPQEKSTTAPSTKPPITTPKATTQEKSNNSSSVKPSAAPRLSTETTSRTKPPVSLEGSSTPQLIKLLPTKPNAVFAEFSQKSNTTVPVKPAATKPSAIFRSFSLKPNTTNPTNSSATSQRGIIWIPKGVNKTQTAFGSLASKNNSFTDPRISLNILTTISSSVFDGYAATSSNKKNLNEENKKKDENSLIIFIAIAGLVGLLAVVGATVGFVVWHRKKDEEDKEVPRATPKIKGESTMENAKSTLEAKTKAAPEKTKSVSKSTKSKTLSKSAEQIKSKSAEITKPK